MSVVTIIHANRRVSRVAHQVERIGLSMSGAISGTFVAAYMAKTGIVTFDTIGFVGSMIVIGMIGFYLGVDIPGMNARLARLPAPIECLGAAGTFLAAVAALISVYAIVFDEQPLGPWELTVGSCWVLGVIMQVGAGAAARWRLAAVTVH
jgi:hypothetical protein